MRGCELVRMGEHADVGLLIWVNSVRRTAGFFDGVADRRPELIIRPCRRCAGSRSPSPGCSAAALTAYVWSAHGAKPGVLLLLGLGLGVALFHSRFGFTSAWRQLVAVGNGAGLRAHALLLGTTATLFALVIGTGTGLFGSQPAPSAGPLGVGLLVGAFLFAIGMQLGGACASGTLFAVGSGQSSIVLTLGGFIAGSTLAAWQFDLWKDLPASTRSCSPTTSAGSDPGP